jgi:hypothetical protein
VSHKELAGRFPERSDGDDRCTLGLGRGDEFLDERVAFETKHADTGGRATVFWAHTPAGEDLIASVPVEVDHLEDLNRSRNRQSSPLPSVGVNDPQAQVVDDHDLGRTFSVEVSRAEALRARDHRLEPRA